MGRRHLRSTNPHVWRAQQDPRGHWRVFNSERLDPLRTGTMLDRCRAAYLQAAAGYLFEALEWALERVAYHERGYGDDQALLGFGWLTIKLAKPPYELVRELSRIIDQEEMELDDAA